MPINEIVRRASEERPREVHPLDEAIKRADHHLGPRPTLTSTDIVDSYNSDIDGEYPVLTRQLTAYTNEVAETETFSGRDWAGNPFEVELFHRVHHGPGINDIGFEIERSKDGRREYVSLVYTKPGQEVDVYVSPMAELKRQLSAVKKALGR